MSLFQFFKSRGTAPVTRGRLQILLTHERAALGPRDLVAILRDDLLANIARHIEFDPEKLSVKMDRAGAFSTLEIDGDSERQNQLGGSSPHAPRPGLCGLRQTPPTKQGAPGTRAQVHLGACPAWTFHGLSAGVCLDRVHIALPQN